MGNKGRIKLDKLTFTTIAVAVVASAAIGSGGYRIATGRWPWQQTRENAFSRSHTVMRDLDEARHMVPFSILMPSWMPAGFELGPVALLTSPQPLPVQTQGGVNGVSINYTRDGRLVLSLEEKLADIFEGYSIGNARLEGTVTVRDSEIYLWRGESADGRPQNILVWDEPSGVNIRLISYLPVEETLRIANSLR